MPGRDGCENVCKYMRVRGKCMWNNAVIQQDICPEIIISVVSKVTLMFGQEDCGPFSDGQTWSCK